MRPNYFFKVILIKALVTISLTLTAQNVTIKIKGSDTMLPLSMKEAEGYMKKNPNAKIIVNGGGSNTGIKALMDNSADICMASRKIKESEKLELTNRGLNVHEIIVAIDALAIIVNPNNKVNALTIQDLENIFTGKATNWKEFGGDDLKIIVFSREASSGTYVFFQEHVLSNKPYGPSTILMPNTESIVEQVSQTRGAIGYVGHAYVEKGIKTISIANKDEIIDPTIDNVRNHTYPISRPLYYYYTKNNEKLVKPFLDFVLSKEGQEIVFLVGYVPVK